MRKRHRIAAVVCGLVLALLGVGILAFFKALRYEPEFYRQAIAVAPAIQRRASAEMLRQSGALWSDVQNKERWAAIFTAGQINGWLAVDLVENHADTLPTYLRDPRVAIEPDRITLACRFQQDGLTSVVTLSVEPFLPEPNVLGLRICKARAGLLPWPLAKITDGISEAANQNNLRLEWRQANGAPVALISIPPLHDENDKLVQIETLRVGEGEIYVAGATRPREATDVVKGRLR